MSGKNNFLGIDTSNYTTSAAVYSDSGMNSSRKLLPVRPGERGLRQSDAVYQHLKQFAEVFSSLPHPDAGTAIGVSAFPRTAEGSYMPCFQAGVSFAEVLARVYDCPLYRFSHQQGHIAAGLWSAGREDLYESSFLAFHISGGTTELLSVEPRLRNIRVIAHSLDLHAGQLIDRIGVLLGYPFPCGKFLDKDARNAGLLYRRRRVSLKDGCCCLSGYENQAQNLIREGASNKEVAFFTLSSICSEIEAMIEAALPEFPNRELLMIGGVCSNSLLRERISERYGAVFAGDGYSCDNAAGIAFLAKKRYEEELH